MTQSTLSHQIKQLEDELGTRLFDRIGKRVHITESGEVFLAFVARALKEVDQGLGALRQDPNALSGQIRIGATHTFSLQFIPSCVATFVERFPGVRVCVDELASDAIASGLKQGRLDLGITYRPDGPANLLFEPLYNEELMLVVAHSHPFAQRRRLRMVELHRQRMVLLPKAFATRQLLDECFAACGAEPLVVAEMNTIAPMLGLVERTAIAAIAARNAVIPARPLHVIPLESPTPIRTPGMLMQRQPSQDSPVTAFASIVRKIAVDSARRPHTHTHTHWAGGPAGATGRAAGD